MRAIPAVIEGAAFVTAEGAGFVGDYATVPSAQASAAKASIASGEAVVWTLAEDPDAHATRWAKHGSYVRGYRVRAAHA